jgi:hypothetical protein
MDRAEHFARADYGELIVITDSLTGSITGANGTQIGVTDALLAGPLGTDSITGLPLGSPLLYDLWYNNPNAVLLENNPTYGGHTKTFVLSGVETTWIDAAIYPGAAPVTLSGGQPKNYALANIDELAEVIGHELSHAEVQPLLQAGYTNYVAASTLGLAVGIGETNEGLGYTFQYVIAEQLSDIGNSGSPVNTSFHDLNSVFNALQSVANKDNTIFLLTSVRSISY